MILLSKLVICAMLVSVGWAGLFCSSLPGRVGPEDDFGMCDVSGLSQNP